MFVSETVGSLLQFVVVLLLVGLFWLVGHRLLCVLRIKPHQGFLKWVGLQKPKSSIRDVVLVLVGVNLLVFVVLQISGFFGVEGLRTFSSDSPVAKLATIESVPLACIAALFYAFVRTGGAEELIFRGWFFKRLVNGFGFLPANIIQGAIFAGLHNLLFLAVSPNTTFGAHLEIFLVIGISSWVCGWYMIRKDDGSIFFPWLAHGTGNFLVFVSALWARFSR